MQLLIAVINHEEQVDDILAGFVALGITGATVVASTGMGRVLGADVPIFAGLRSLGADSRPGNRTIFCVAEDEKVEAAMALVERVCGALSEPGRGIAFSVPVARVVGLKAALDS